MADHLFDTLVPELDDQGCRGSRRVVTPPEVLKLKEAAKLMRVCTKTLVSWAVAGKVPGEKVGHDWRFRRSKLLEILNGRSAA